MKKLCILTTVLLNSAPVWAEESSTDNEYIQPYPHSSAAELLPYCEQTDVVVSQLRCDYYVQGVADLVTIPRKGRPMACIPRGKTRTQLMEVVVAYLQKVHPDQLEQESAASLILSAFIKSFPCPKFTKSAAKNSVPGLSPAEVEALKQRMKDIEKSKAKK